MKKNNLNTLLLKRRHLVFSTPFFMIFILAITYSLLLFFNVQSVYAINDNKSKIASQQNTNISLQSTYLSRVSELEQDLEKEKYRALQKVVYLDESLNNVALNR